MSDLPDQLLDIHAICDQRDFWRSRAQKAEELIRDAPIHHHGRDYQTWRDRRDAFFAEICKHPEEWRTHGKCGICLTEVQPVPASNWGAPCGDMDTTEGNPHG